MASVDFKKGKCHSGTEVSAILRHCDPSPESRARVLAAKTEAGEPCHIDPSKSDKNYIVTVEGTWFEGPVKVIQDDGSYYKKVFGKYKKQVRYFDAFDCQTNRRKDRMDVCFLEIPFPKELSGFDTETYEKGQRWIVRVVECIRDVYRGKMDITILPGVVHVDEVHDYYHVEKDMMRESVFHAHIPCMTVNTETGSFNGKWFSSREHMRKVNNSIQKMSMEEFGVSFLTGEKYKSLKTVERLKAESEAAENEMRIAKLKLREEQKKVEAEAERMKKVLSDVDSITEDILRQLRESQNRSSDDYLMDDVEEFCEWLTKRDGKINGKKKHFDLFKEFHAEKNKESRKSVEEEREALQKKLISLSVKLDLVRAGMDMSK